MLIAAVDVDLIDLPAVAPPFAWRRGLRGSPQARTTAVLRITTEDGAVGEAYHEWSGPMLADIVDRVLREELVGERADRREWLWHRLWELDCTEEFPIWLFGVVDVALWDLEARRLGVPVSVAGDLQGRDPGVRVDDDLSDAGGVLRRRGGMTGAMRIAYLADSFRLRAEVHGPTESAVHLCMAIPNNTYDESLVTSNPAVRESRVGPDGHVQAPTKPGIALPHFVAEHRATPIS